MTYKYGIDFGTTNTSVAIGLPSKLGHVKPNVLLLDPASMWGPAEFMRSIFYIDARGSIHIGSDADNQMDLDEYAGRFSVDRYITQIKMSLDDGAFKTISVGGMRISSVMLLTAMFKKLKEKADKFAYDKGISLHGVVLGVPVSFSEENKHIYLQALCNAGYYRTMDEAVKQTEFVSEPVAVAINYGEKLVANKRVMVFDYGGGTLDIAVIDLKEQIGKNDKLHPHKVIGKSAGYNIGGERINKEFFINFFVPEYGLANIKAFLGISDYYLDTAEKLWAQMKNRSSGIKFAQQIDRCKRSLSTNDTVIFTPPDIRSPGKKLRDLSVTREDFEEAVEQVFIEIDQVIKACLADCENYVNANGVPEPVFPTKISEVLLAGGSSLIPRVKDILAKYFDRNIIGKNAENKLLPEKEVLESIVRGLAIQGCKQNEVVEEVVDCAYGIGKGSDATFSEIIPRGTSLSSVATDIFNDRAGLCRSYTTGSTDAATLVVKIMQRTYGVNNEKDKILKEIRIPLNDQTGYDFDIYLSIDKSTKMLTLKIYFAKKKSFVFLKPDQSQIKINL